MIEDYTNKNTGSDIYMDTSYNGEQIRRAYETKPWKSDQQIYDDVIEEEQGNSDNEIEYVDLGLPSGLLWATCNLGASSPEEYGKYYQWGDTEGYYEDQIGSEEGQKMFNWSDYKYAIEEHTTSVGGFLVTSLKLTKYCNNSVYGYEGYTDDLVELEPSDDAATVELGNGWRIPSYDDVQELWDNTTYSFDDESRNVILTSNINGNAIIFPPAGYAEGGFVQEKNGNGYYWSCSLDIDGGDPKTSWCFAANAPSDSSLSTERHEGQSIRPVKNQ